jgi:hypothetical protein
MKDILRIKDAVGNNCEVFIGTDMIGISIRIEWYGFEKGILRWSTAISADVVHSTKYDYVQECIDLAKDFYNNKI